MSAMKLSITSFPPAAFFGATAVDAMVDGAADAAEGRPAGHAVILPPAVPAVLPSFARREATVTSSRTWASIVQTAVPTVRPPRKVA